MKIYISCNGLGLGHVGRTLVIAKYLKDRGDKVIFGTWGPGVKFARKEGFFCYKLPKVDWKDKQDGSFDLFGTILRTPLIIFGIICQLFWERNILKKEKPDIVISDGTSAHCISLVKGIPALSIDHQMDFPLKSKITSIIIREMHNISFKISKRGIVLDFKAPENIYPYSISKIKNITYTGPLIGSLWEEYDTQKEIKKKLKIEKRLCAIIISGPKNSPIALEKEIIKIENKLVKMKDWMFIIKVQNKYKNKKNIRYVTWIDDVFELIKASDVVVSRAGYGSTCNNLAFFKKAILIPQPKQTEQETLAKHLKERKIVEIICKDADSSLPKLRNVE